MRKEIYCECCGLIGGYLNSAGHIGMRLIGFQAIRLCRYCGDQLEKLGRCEH